MARRRIARYTQEDLTRMALLQSERHPFQKLAILEMIAKRFRVNSINHHPRTGDYLITMRFEGDAKVGAAVYPDGSVSRQNGTIRWEWKRVEDAASATIPDSFVAHLVAKEA